MGNKKILIIDDDADITESLKVVLESNNYSVVTAESGEEGMKKVGIEKPDMIILDVMMETVDKGFEISRELKKNPEYKNIPILMLTAIKEKTKLDFKKEAGDADWLPVDDFCDTPLDPDELLEKTKKLLQKA